MHVTKHCRGVGFANCPQEFNETNSFTMKMAAVGMAARCTMCEQVFTNKVIWSALTFSATVIMPGTMQCIA